jgi:hypothetical protein
MISIGLAIGFVLIAFTVGYFVRFVQTRNRKDACHHMVEPELKEGVQYILEMSKDKTVAFFLAHRDNHRRYEIGIKVPNTETETATRYETVATRYTFEDGYKAYLDRLLIMGDESYKPLGCYDKK